MAVTDRVRSETFSDFVSEVEPRLRQALTGSLGSETGREATAEALAYGWEHWERIEVMDNPVGYLFRVGQRWGRRARSRTRTFLPAVDPTREPWVEPKLPEAMRKLSERQRLVVFLQFGHDWTLSEIAELLGVSKASVQSYSDRGMGRLRTKLGVDR